MKSIALKLWLGMLALVVVILLLLWLFQIEFLNSYYINMRVSQIEEKSREVIALIYEGQDFEEALELLAYDYNMSVELIDSEGSIVYSTGASGMNGQMNSMARNKTRVDVLDAALAGEQIQGSASHPRFGGEYLIIGFPVSSGGGIDAALLVSLPLAAVEDTADILKRQMVYIMLILFISTILLTFLLSRSFTKPVKEITGAAMAMAAGNLSARVQTGRKDELGKLAETINYMGEELSKVDQLRKDLVANVSHELRTPLSLIKGYAETIRDVTGDDKDKRERQIGVIIEESDRLSGMVGDILNLSQMQAGLRQPSFSIIDLDEFLEKVRIRYDVVVTETGVNLKIEKEKNLKISADLSMIEQVIYNLVNNAFGHTPAGGSVIIHAARKTEKVRIEIKDTGEGISKEDLAHIWDRFYKKEKPGVRGKAGTGLGLSIVKNILTAHKAQFGAESIEGQGAVFWFELSAR